MKNKNPLYESCNCEKVRNVCRLKSADCVRPFNPIFKILESAGSLKSSHPQSLSGGGEIYSMYIVHTQTHTHVPLAKMDVPGHCLCRTELHRGTRRPWAFSQSPPGVGSCRAIFRTKKIE